MKVAVYKRVSTVGQNLESQTEAIDRYLEGHDITPIVVLEDKSTGNNINRAGFERLQELVFNGEIDTVVMYKMDRLSRNLKEGLNLLIEWVEKGINVIFVAQQLDLSSISGKLMASLLLAFAEYDNANRKENQKLGIVKAKERGAYVNHGRNKGENIHSHNKIMKLFKEGHTKTDIAKFVGCSRMTVHRVVSANLSG